MASPYSGFTTNLLNNVDAAVHGFTQTAYQNVVGAHQTEIYLVLVLYIALFGFGVLRGTIDFTLARAVRHIFFMSVVVAVATRWDYFALFFGDVFTDGPAKLLAALSGGAFDPNAMLSDVFDRGILAANEINKAAGFSTFGFLIIGYAVFFTTIICVGYALFLLVLAKLALAVLLALAPLFFLLLLFQGTRDFFSQYLRQIVNFAFIPILTSAILALTLKIVSDAVTRLQAVLASHSGHGGPECVYVILCFAVLFMLLHQVASLAAALAGGLQLSIHGMVGMMANASSYGFRLGWQDGKKGARLGNQAWRYGKEKVGSLFTRPKAKV